MGSVPVDDAVGILVRSSMRLFGGWGVGNHHGFRVHEMQLVDGI